MGAANTKPPVPLYGLDGTYASALYTASAKQESLNDVSKGLENLYNTFKTDKQLQAIMSAPTLSASDKSQVVQELQKTMAVQDKDNTIKNKMVKQLETAVSKSQYIGQGQKLKVVPKVDPEIRGGLIVEIGDRTIDLSVSAKMARMNKLLTETL